MIKGMPFDYDATLSEETQYTAEFTRNFIKSELTNGVYPLNFVQSGSTNAANAIGTCFAVKRATNTSRTLVVCPGAAVIEGLRILSDTDVEVDVPSVTGIGVFDIVLQADFTAQKVTIICQQRDVDTSAARANAMIRTGIKYQLCLATVKTTDHSITYLQDTRLITDRCSDGKPLCGLVSSIYQTDTASVIKMMDDYIDALANKIIQGSNLADRSVTTDKLDNGAVTFDKIALHAVKGGVNGNIAPGTIDSYNIKESGVLEENIDSEAVTTAKIAGGAITIEKLATELINKVNDEFIIDMTIETLAELNDTFSYGNFGKTYDDKHLYRITPNMYNTLIKELGYNVGNGFPGFYRCYLLSTEVAQIMFIPGVNHILQRQYVNYSGSFENEWSEYYLDIANGSVTTEKLADGAVTSDKLSDNSVTTVKLTDKSVTSAKIADGAITTTKIGDGKVTSAKINSSAVTTEKLADHSVTSTKLANGAVTHGAIAANAIVAENISKGAVTADKLSTDVTTAITQNTADITKLKTDTLDNTEAITQNTADIDELKVKSLPSVNLTLPPAITTIPDIAFCANQSLVSVTLHDKITSIGVGAFRLCKNLASATIGSGVKSIGDGAFLSCTSLTSITIPDSVTSIGVYAFTECSSLTSITIPNSVTSIGNSAFSSCTSLASVTIPNSVTSIGINAFNGCSSLTSITISDSVTSIAHSMFYNCSSLASVIIPNSVTSIDATAFYGCIRLTDVTIPNSVTSINGNAFTYCPNLANVILGDGFNANNLDLSASTKYTADTIVSWLNALADRTGQTAYTLTIGATNKAKLTTEQLAIATNKNWKIA